MTKEVNRTEVIDLCNGVLSEDEINALFVILDKVDEYNISAGNKPAIMRIMTKKDGIYLKVFKYNYATWKYYLEEVYKIMN